jgi:Ca2+-binding RTX toxin-like protein
VPITNVTVTAGPGEQNRLTAAYGTGGLQLHDPAGLTPSAPCLAVDAQSVTCPVNGLNFLVSLGDGDDSYSETRPLAVKIDGGAGDDVISARYGWLTGGPGNDQLTGRNVIGGEGDDVLAGELLDYSDHAGGVTIDVGAGVGGSEGEQDRLTPGFGSVVGGPGPDVIRVGPKRLTVAAGAGDDMVYGSPGSDQLGGGPGNDHLIGGAEVDYLDGGPGNDVLDGGAGADDLRAYDGADTILARDGERDVVDCSQMRLEGDRATVDAGDATYGCDHVERAGAKRLEPHAVVRTGARTRVLVASCPAAARAAACAGLIHFGRGRRSEQVSFRVVPGRRARIAIKLRRNLYGVRVTLRTGKPITWIADFRS